jgi:hypothetical protein
MSRSINPMSSIKTGTEPFPASPRSHRFDESATSYSSTSCSPALLVSASPADLYRQADDMNLSTRLRKSEILLWTSAAEARQTINYQGGPIQMIEVGQAGRSNSDMASNGITGETQETIVGSITSFAQWLP